MISFRTSDLLRKVDEYNWKSEPSKYWSGKQILFMNADGLELYAVVSAKSETEMTLAFIDATTNKVTDAKFHINTYDMVYLGQNDVCVFFSTFPLVGKHLFIKGWAQGEDFGIIQDVDRGIIKCQIEEDGKTKYPKAPLTAFYQRKYFHYNLNGNNLTFRQNQFEEGS